MKSAIIAIAALAAATMPAHAEGDAAKGEKAFKICKACHEVDAATNKTGPHLKGITGRPIASVEGFAYSEAMKSFAAANPAWTDELLDQYIAAPKTLIPKNKMAFAGIKKPEQRADLIAYLKTKP